MDADGDAPLNSLADSAATRRFLLMRAAALFSCVFAATAWNVGAVRAEGPVSVQLKREGGRWSLLRNGAPYAIRGVGGNGDLKLLKSLGGNSIRTWSTDGLDDLLRQAQEQGLTVAVGLWLGHQRHGFDYSNADAVAAQEEKIREMVLKYKDHPAVLLWGVGNEMEGYGDANDASVWLAVNSIARMIKRIDPHHPTMSVVAEIGGQRVRNLHRLCPDVDIVGVNSYGGAASIPKRYREAGGTKPYVLTEYGPPGFWEAKQSEWGRPVEPTSHEKANVIRTAHRSAIAEEQSLALGGYAFLWGWKQEATHTWFSLLPRPGERVEATDVLSEFWTGKPPANRCPRILELKTTGAVDGPGGREIPCVAKIDDPENDSLKLTWELRGEPWKDSVGGDAQEEPPVYRDAVRAMSAGNAMVTLPKDGGDYRLYLFAADGQGGVATANLPLRVAGPVKSPSARKVTLPFVVYDEADRVNPPYAPSGWMGNTKGMKLDPECREQPHAGSSCMKVEYSATGEWAGIVWQHPANDWGDAPGGYDLTGAKRLVFWARGAEGGETVSAELGLYGSDKKFGDTGRGKLSSVSLTAGWKEYSIDLAGQNLSRIKSGFAFTVAGQGKPIRFFLDDVRFE